MARSTALARAMRRVIDRWRAHARLRSTVGLWYHPEYAPACLNDTCRVDGLPVDRVDRALASVVREGLLRRGDVRPSPVATLEDLGRVHTPAYLESIGAAAALARIFGLEPDRVLVDPLIRAQRRAVGGTMAAAAAAVRGEVSLALNLGGGFHHAAPDQGGAFCVFHDIAVAVAALRAQGFAGKVVVVDLDYHQDDGTLTTFAQDPSVFTLSIHGSVWSHVEAEGALSVLLPEGTGDEAYLARLQSALPEVLRRERPALVFYLAGQDVLRGDRLGGFALTRQGLLHRDAFVIDQVRAARAALVITLGGGYADHTWMSVADLIRLVLTGHPGAVREPRSLPDHYRAVARSLDPASLRGEEGHLLTEEDVLGQLSAHRGSTRYLDYYSAHGLEYALERYGVLEKLRRRGFADFQVAIDVADPERQVARLTASKAGREGLLLVELVTGRRRLEAPEALGESVLDLLNVEWLLLQDPTGDFSLEHPQMPGQEQPGLGIARDLEALLEQACVRLELDGVLAHPAHYHNALLATRFHFLDPAVEGRLLALGDVLAGRSLVDASRHLEAGAVRLASGEAIGWTPQPQVLPVSPRLKAYFEGPEWTRARDAARQALREGGLLVVVSPPPPPAPAPVPALRRRTSPRRRA